MTKDRLQDSRSLCLVLVFISCSMLVVVSPAFAGTLGFNPRSSTVVLGQSVMVDVVVSELGSETIGSIDLNVQFNPTKLQLNGVIFGLGLGDPALLEALTNFQTFPLSPIAEIVNFSEISFLDDRSLSLLQGEFVSVAILSFQGVSVGMDTLRFMDLGASEVPPSGIPLQVTAGSGDTLSLTSRGIANVTTTLVPDPNTFSLMLLGLVGLLLRRQWLFSFRIGRDEEAILR